MPSPFSKFSSPGGNHENTLPFPVAAGALLTVVPGIIKCIVPNSNITHYGSVNEETFIQKGKVFTHQRLPLQINISTEI